MVVIYGMDNALLIQILFIKKDLHKIFLPSFAHLVNKILSLFYTSIIYFFSFKKNVESEISCFIQLIFLHVEAGRPIGHVELWNLHVGGLLCTWNFGTCM